MSEEKDNDDDSIPTEVEMLRHQAVMLKAALAEWKGLARDQSLALFHYRRRLEQFIADIQTEDEEPF